MYAKSYGRLEAYTSYTVHLFNNTCRHVPNAKPADPEIRHAQYPARPRAASPARADTTGSSVAIVVAIAVADVIVERRVTIERPCFSLRHAIGGSHQGGDSVWE